MPLVYGFTCGLFSALLGLLRFCSAVVRRARVPFTLVLSAKAFVMALRPAVASVLAPCESSQLPRKKRSSESLNTKSPRLNLARIAVEIARILAISEDRLLARLKRTGIAYRASSMSS